MMNTIKVWDSDYNNPEMKQLPIRLDDCYLGEGCSCFDRCENSEIVGYIDRKDYEDTLEYPTFSVHVDVGYGRDYSVKHKVEKCEVCNGTGVEKEKQHYTDCIVCGGVGRIYSVVG